MQKDITFFWNNRTPLSNWYPSEFEYLRMKFSCGEQYMMYMKAATFMDIDSATAIMDTRDPARQKELGRGVKNYDDHLWSLVRKPIMVAGLYQKFLQCEVPKKALLDTGNTILAEANPHDRIWGIGLAASDPRASDPSKWLGQNLLGEVLTEVRSRLRGYN